MKDTSILAILIITYIATAIITITPFPAKAKLEAQTITHKSDSIITIVFAGDMMGHSGQYKAAYIDSIDYYNYDDCFIFVKDYVSSADIACVNLEVPIAGKPYSTYPRFNSPDELLDGLKDAGFDVIFTANNHVVDKGKKGLERTIQQIQHRGLRFAGSYCDSAQRSTSYPLIIDCKGLRIALLNYTYGVNGLPISDPNIVNMIDSNLILNDIQRANELHADLKIMTIHWGNEYQLHSDHIQQGLARFFVDNGIDLIIGGHPHVVQEADTLFTATKKPVVTYYSIGNYISNQRDPHTNGGIMVKVEINKYTGKIIRTSYLPSFVHRGTLPNRKYQYYLIPTPDYIANPTQFELSKQDSTDLMFFHRQTYKRLSPFTLWETR